MVGFCSLRRAPADFAVGDMPNTTSATSGSRQEQGEKAAENTRHSQNNSETGMDGGMDNSSGSANQDGGAPKESTSLGDRATQGYGAGNDVGA